MPRYMDIHSLDGRIPVGESPLTMRRSISLLLASLAALALLGSTVSASANAGHRPVTNRDLQTIRAATAQYHNIATALANGYVPFVDINGVSCIAEPGMGGMGVHFVKPALIQDPAINPRPAGSVRVRTRPRRHPTARGPRVPRGQGSPGRRRTARRPSCSRATPSTRRTPQPVRPRRLLLATRLGLETQPRRVARHVEPQRPLLTPSVARGSRLPDPVIGSRDT